jgi:(p)ppGpp synthase/HD superfamily hydrolase
MAKPCYSWSLDDAISLAADAFRDRRRKGSDVPYLTHLLQVMTWVGEHDGDEQQMIAAVLHDYLEDVDPNGAPELERRYGARVAQMVRMLSELGDKTTPWKQRKTEYVARLAIAPSEVKLIAVADKLHNARSMLRDHAALGDALWQRFNAPKDEVLWYYRSVLAGLAQGWSHPMLEELREAVRALERL